MSSEHGRMDRNELIAGLVADLKPTPRRGRVAGAVALWLAGTTLFALLVTAVTGPFREGAVGQAVAHPRFGMESLVGGAAILLLAANAFRTGIPLPGGAVRLVAPALALTALWLASYVLGLWYPALEPSMAGKRAQCVLETLVYGLPPLLAGLYLVRRLWPLHGWASGLLLGLAAGLIPALIMQFACMYVPAHILTHHVLPGLSMGLVGAVLGHLFLRPPA